MSTTIDDRVILLLKEFSEAVPRADEVQALPGASRGRGAIGGHGFWERLAERTQVPAQRWRNVLVRRQKPTLVMVEALARRWPQYAFWLTTGITDTANGHIAPVNTLTFPEREQYVDSWSPDYFWTSLRLIDRLYMEAGVDLSSDEKRMEATLRTRQFAKMASSPLASTAYKLAATEEYAELVWLWEQREKERPAHVGRLIGTNRPEETRRKRGVVGDPLIGGDGRGAHQNPWDLFYKPKP